MKNPVREQDRVGDVQEQVGYVVASRIRAEKPAIDHVADPCQRVPVRGVAFGKRPDDRFAGEPFVYVRVFRDVFVVVIVDEFIDTNTLEGNKSNTSKKQAKPESF